MAELFPIIQPQASAAANALPVCRDVKWDYAKNAPAFKDGEPVFVEGKDAVESWAWRALNTERFRYEMFSTDYGSELNALIGKPYTGDLKRAEAVRYVREALMPNPYVKDVREIGVTFADGVLSVSCILESVYGEVQIHV